MTKYATHKGRDIPQVNIPDNLLAERRLQVIHGYFQWWIEALVEAFGMEKAKELAIEWGRKKGIHTGRLYGKYFKKKGIALNDLPTIMYEIGRSAGILGERSQGWIEGDKAVVRTLVCPTGKLFVELGLGLDCCVKQCDAFVEETWKQIPEIGSRRTKGIDTDDFCEWVHWIQK